VVGIGNHEHEPVDYTVVVELQNVTFEGNESVVREESELGRLRTGLADNETWTRTYEVTPTMTGERLRLAFLLYNESVPDDPTVENAYRETHLWVNVSQRGSTAGSLASSTGDAAPPGRLRGPGPTGHESATVDGTAPWVSG
jgi:hypothetical protein